MRAYNFSAGPSALPQEILRESAAELLEYGTSGCSVMEMSHRSHDFEEILEDAKQRLVQLLNIPAGYSILFLQGGAHLQFAGIPMNLAHTGKVGYIVSGNWSKKAAVEATKYAEVDIVASSEECDYRGFPVLPTSYDTNLSYLYLCQNETVYGTMTRELPQTDALPLVADVSSMFLSCPLDVSRYGLIYAGAQKNAGPAGTTIIIIRDDLIRDTPAFAQIPSYMDYNIQKGTNSLYNTPNCWGIYMCGKVFSWIQDEGGLSSMEEKNWAKVNKLYNYLDASNFYQTRAQKAYRSISNVVFSTPTPALDAAFVNFARERHIIGLKGHRLVGGLRASCYNAVPMEAVDALLDALEDFAAQSTR